MRRQEEFAPNRKNWPTITGRDRPLTVEKTFSGWVSLLQRGHGAPLMTRWAASTNGDWWPGRTGMNAHPEFRLARCA